MFKIFWFNVLGMGILEPGVITADGDFFWNSVAGIFMNRLRPAGRSRPLKIICYPFVFLGEIISGFLNFFRLGVFFDMVRVKLFPVIAERVA